MRNRLLAAAATCALSLTAGLPAAAQMMSAYNQVVGAPEKTGKVVVQITVEVNGKPTTRDVTIPSGTIQAFTPPPCGANDKIADCATALADAMSTASQNKAKVFRDAVNQAFANEFKALGQTASTGLTVKSRRIFVRRNGVAFPQEVDIPLGDFTIPGVNDKGKVVWKENGVMGEGGNGGRIINTGGGGGTPGGRGSLDRSTPGVETVATGVDALGDPSEVEFGLDGIYVAEVDPSAGMTDAEILELLAADLDAHGIPATFDATDEELSLDNPVLDGQMLDWGYTDTGLNFDESLVGLDVDEPPVWALLLPALLCGMILCARTTMRG